MADLALIKQLRESTGCGISDCNKALAETNNNIDEAIAWLRKKGLSSAAKKSGRVASEGLISINVEGNSAVMIEVNSETDFVARNEQFQNFVNEVTKIAKGLDTNLEDDDFAEKLRALPFSDTCPLVSDALTEKIAVIGENIQIRRGKKLALDGNGAIVSYVHNACSPTLGRIGVLVALKSDADKNALEELGKKIAMHIAATKPEFLKESDINADRIAKEKEIYAEQAKQSGKPDNIIEKMIEGRIKKFYEEVVLLDQAFVMDPDKKISDILAEFAKETGKSVEIQDYALYVLGEGIEKKSEEEA